MLHATFAREPQVKFGTGSNSAFGGMYWQLASACEGKHSSSFTSQTNPSGHSLSASVAQVACAQGPAGVTHCP
jgi:hypothetical protein